MVSRHGCHGSRAGRRSSMVPFERGKKSATMFDFSKYPGDLLWQVLGRLPLRSLLACRCVCRQWNSLLKDPQFHRFWASVHSGGPFSFYHEFMKLVLANTKDHSVITFDGFFYLSKAINDGEDRYIIDPASVYLKKLPRLPFEVSSLKKLPRLPFEVSSTPDCWHSDWAVGMAVSPGNRIRSYSIFVASIKFSFEGFLSREEPASIYQYDSRDDAWHLACRFPYIGVLWKRRLRSVVMHQGSLYSLSEVVHHSQYRKGDDVFEVARYEERSGRWEYLTSGFPALLGLDRCLPLLFEHNGKLLLASLCLGRYCIWQYHDERRAWSLLQMFPHEFTARFDGVTSKSSEFSFSAQSCENCLHVAKWPSVNCEMPFVMTYDLVNRHYEEMLADEVQSKLVNYWQEKILFHPAR